MGLTAVFFSFFLGLSSAFGASEALVSLGERLFNDTRFSRSFWLQSGADVNNWNVPGEPKLEWMEVPSGEIASPFKGQNTSCASCHLVDQAFEEDEAGMRTYTDFSARVEIPRRVDEYVKEFAARNTPGLVGIGSAFNRNRFSHRDGEFSDHNQTVLGNFAGRNMGWLPEEKELALNNVVKVIKEDDGQGELALEFGGSYQKVFLGVDPGLPEEFRLAPAERVDIAKANKDEVLAAVVKAVGAYMNDLDFQTDEKGRYAGSPFDRFLLKNGFSTVPEKGESNKSFTQRLRGFLKNLTTPKYVEFKVFKTHGKSFGFGQRELAGAKVFFNASEGGRKTGSCFKCHQAPLFTDQSFHNVGTAQFEYDGLHGSGAFASLKVPNESKRKNIFLNQAPAKEDPDKVDLGLWNFYLRNKKVSEFFQKEVCPNTSDCPLSLTLGRFKTPGLRNLAHSNPYFHNGKAKSLRDVLVHYIQASSLEKRGSLRNGDSVLREISLDARALENLELFLSSLNEDYD